MSFENKVILVTGASRGIGKAIAESFANQSATVVGTATSQSGADNITATLKDANLKGQGVVMNVGDQASIDVAWSQIQTDVGVPNIVINNAGITRDNLMLRMKQEEWDDVINTNLNGIFRLTKMCLKPMIKARWGRIVNLSSVVGVTGNGGQANYAASKAAVIGFSKSLAQEIASRNVTVNVVAPGYIQTDMTGALGQEVRDQLLKFIPMQRVGDVKDIADAVGFLASDAASYITGQTLHVNGGMFMA